MLVQLSVPESPLTRWGSSLPAACCEPAAHQLESQRHLCGTRMQSKISKTTSIPVVAPNTTMLQAVYLRPGFPFTGTPGSSSAR